MIHQFINCRKTLRVCEASFLGYLEVVWGGEIEFACFALQFLLAVEEKGFADVLGLAAVLVCDKIGYNGRGASSIR